eukprot:CAMPEP_0171328764 /NCGR_PEP_ID=MMETSP0878-20121228/839_1 /TAXON_ID=67004 /ORGANISM="Thalassiosira weissflogii, Strain CCMP1336" /LENGTH=304 /DNA_ID=CAMNT_0011828641 /DNA_START=47 /DNA_END=961 /DNA_ORIENTATION=+
MASTSIINIGQSLTVRMSRLAIRSSVISSTFQPFAQSLTSAAVFKVGPIISPSSFAVGNHVGYTLARSFTSAANTPLKRRDSKTNVDYGATSSLGTLLSQEQAEKFAAFLHANQHQKVKPFIVKRRMGQLRTYIGNERNIRHSPWRMNLVCQFAAGLTVPEALKQLMFCQKVKAPLVAKVIRRTSNLADIRHGLQPSQLEVAECFATHGSHLKRIKIMGRGRSGKKHRRHSHIRLVLREIDFPTKLLKAETLNQKRLWLERLSMARADYEKARIERAEIAELEAQAAKVEEAKRKEEEEAEQKK